MMAANNTAEASETAAKELAAEEEAIIEAMRRLKLLHIKERLLRNTISKMINPLVKKQPSPDALFEAFTQAVKQAQKDIQEFTDLMNDETSKAVFARAEKSREENPNGIVPWRHKDHPHWFDLDMEDY